MLSITCPPMGQAMACWTHTRSWARRGSLGAVATGFLMPCNAKAEEYKSPTQRTFRLLWQSLPLTCAPRAYCAYDEKPRMISSGPPRVLLRPRQERRHDADNSASAKGSQPAGSSSRVPRTNKVPDAEERDKGYLMWRDEELDTCCPHYKRLLTAALGAPRPGR